MYGWASWAHANLPRRDCDNRSRLSCLFNSRISTTVTEAIVVPLETGRFAKFFIERMARSETLQPALRGRAAASSAWRGQTFDEDGGTLTPRVEFVTDRHVLDTADEARAQPRHWSRQFCVLEAFRKRCKDHFQFQPRQIRPETEMLTDSECQMRVRIAADVELERLIENILVAVGRRMEQAHRLAGANLL